MLCACWDGFLLGMVIKSVYMSYHILADNSNQSWETQTSPLTITAWLRRLHIESVAKVPKKKRVNLTLRSKQEHREFHCLIQELKPSKFMNSVFTTSQISLGYGQWAVCSLLLSSSAIFIFSDIVFKVIIFTVFGALVKHCWVLRKINETLFRNVRLCYAWNSVMTFQRRNVEKLSMLHRKYTTLFAHKNTFLM